jgi:hypothetical protein
MEAGLLPKVSLVSVSLQKVFIIFSSTEQGTPIIYVSMNYRLGPLGFPQGREAQDRDVLNLGLKDQLAALEWIKANIGAFGGDETKVLATLHCAAIFIHPCFWCLLIIIAGHCVWRKCRSRIHRNFIPEL